MKIIDAKNAPKAIGPYSQGILANETLYVSGQIPFNPKTMTVISDDIKAQTKQSLENVLAIVEEADLSKTNIVKCGIFMKNLSMFNEMNDTYQQFFLGHKPARFAIEAKRLPKDVLIEIEAIAVK